MLNGYKASIWDDEKIILELGNNDGYTVSATELHIQKWLGSKFYIIYSNYKN